MCARAHEHVCMCARASVRACVCVRVWGGVGGGEGAGRESSYIHT